MGNRVATCKTLEQLFCDTFRQRDVAMLRGLMQQLGVDCGLLSTP